MITAEEAAVEVVTPPRATMLRSVTADELAREVTRRLHEAERHAGIDA